MYILYVEKCEIIKESKHGHIHWLNYSINEAKQVIKYEKNSKINRESSRIILSTMSKKVIN